MANGQRNYVKIAKKYARDVKSGKIPAGKFARLACERFLEDLKRKPSGRWFPYYFDEWHAFDVCDFIEKLPHIEGEWEYPTLILEPWQIFILVNVFGFRCAYGERKGLRRFDTVYIEVGRKNAKSTLTSGITLYCLTCEGEQGPQVKVAATTGSQARIVFDVAKAMVEKTPQLADAFDLDPMANSIVCRQNMGSIQPINAKASTQDGLNPHLSVIDELHAHKDRKLFDVLKSARGSRKNSLGWYITTAGYHLDGVCYEQRTLVTKILQGVFQAEHYFGIIYTLDQDDDPYDEAVWIKANPNLGVSVRLDQMRSYAKEAKASPQSEGEFKTKRCNLWLSAANAWLSVQQWDKCSAQISIEDYEGHDCWIGADLADRNDTVAVAYLFENDPYLDVFVRYYLPEDLVEAAADRTSAHYMAWSKQGLFELTEGNITDYDRIEQDIRAECERFVVQGIVFDQYGSAHIASRLVADDLPAKILHKNAKNFTDPSKELEARVQVERIRHDGNQVLRWNISNAVVTKGVDGSIIPKKENKDSPHKIDGLDAIINAIADWLLGTEDDDDFEVRVI